MRKTGAATTPPNPRLPVGVPFSVTTIDDSRIVHRREAHERAVIAVRVDLGIVVVDLRRAGFAARRVPVQLGALPVPCTTMRSIIRRILMAFSGRRLSA